MNMEAIYAQYQPLLHSIAYRMLGSVSDAEDIVQETFLAYSNQNTEPIENKKAYLVKIATNRSLNLLQSARKRRELYTWFWLPEPQADSLQMGPQEQAERLEDVSYALLV